jgi:hypothetical protein
MKKRLRKLSLARETLRALDRSQLERGGAGKIGGGTGCSEPQTNCITVCPSNCFWTCQESCDAMGSCDTQTTVVA